MKTLYLSPEVNFFISILFTFYDIVIIPLLPFLRGVPPPSRGIVGKNRSARSKTLGGGRHTQERRSISPKIGLILVQIKGIVGINA